MPPGLRINLLFVVGCLDSRNCQKTEVCVDQQCVPVTCPPESVSNGQLIPDNMSGLGSRGELVCGQGYQIDGSKATKVRCNLVEPHLGRWHADRQTYLPTCQFGCADDRDCEIDETCHRNECSARTCPTFLPSSHNAVRALLYISLFTWFINCVFFRF